MSKALAVVAVSLAFGFASAAAQPLPAGVKPPAILPGNVLKFDRPASATTSTRWWDLFSEYFTLKNSTALPFKRSVAFLVGVGRYKVLSPNLPAVDDDLTELRNFLLTQGGFDTVFEVRHDNVTRPLIERYMRTEFAKEGLLTKDDRLLFYFSGHGVDQVGQVGYLQFSTAQPGVFDGDGVLPVEDVRQWARIVVAKHFLVVLDACASGLAGVRAKAPVEAIAASLSGQGSGLLITAGTGSEKAWTFSDPAKKSEHSLLTHAILNALKTGTADAAGYGLVTPSGIESQVQLAAAAFEVKFGKKMHPQFSELDRGKLSSEGTFIFLNGSARSPKVPATLTGFITAKSREGPRLVASQSDAQWGEYRRARIVFINEDGTLSRPPQDVVGGAPSWSPDGTRIAFWRAGEQGLELCIMTATGTNVKKLGFAGTGNSRPSWSADSRHLAVLSGTIVDHDDIRTEIVILDVNGLTLTGVVNRLGQGMQPLSPALAPDGRSVAFSGVLNRRRGLIVCVPDPKTC